jgi:hypothetical protein
LQIIRNIPSDTSQSFPGARRSGSFNQFILAVFVALVIAAIMIAVFALVFPLSSCNDPLDPDVRDRIREEWGMERRQHQDEVLKRIVIEHRWRVEDDERVYLRKQWMRETEEHHREENDRRAQSIESNVEEIRAQSIEHNRAIEEREPEFLVFHNFSQRNQCDLLFFNH